MGQLWVRLWELPLGSWLGPLWVRPLVRQLEKTLVLPSEHQLGLRLEQRLEHQSGSWLGPQWVPP